MVKFLCLYCAEEAILYMLTRIYYHHTIIIIIISK
jgi:hypothetical protein